MAQIAVGWIRPSRRQQAAASKTAHDYLMVPGYFTRLGYRVILLDPYRAVQCRRSEGHTAKPDR